MAAGFLQITKWKLPGLFKPGLVTSSGQSSHKATLDLKDGYRLTAKKKKQNKTKRGMGVTVPSLEIRSTIV